MLYLLGNSGFLSGVLCKSFKGDRRLQVRFYATAFAAVLLMCLLVAAPVLSADIWSYYSYVGNAKDLATEPNTLWVATGGGALRIDVISGMIGKLTRSQGLCDNNLTCVAVGHDGTKYFGTYGYGAAIYKDGMVSHVDQNNSGIGSNNVQSVAVDSEGAVWFGSGWRADGVRRCAVSRAEWEFCAPGGD